MTAWLDDAIAQLEQDPSFVGMGMALALCEDALAEMRAQGIDRNDLAARMGVSRRAVNRIFDAPDSLTLQTVARLAIALGCRPELSIKKSLTCGDTMW